MSLVYLFSFVFGAVIGSFLSAAVWRMKVGESLARGRSKCPHCLHTLGVLDLVPVLSFLALKGHCRHCTKKIHPSYFFIELTTALAFVAIIRVVGLDFEHASSLATLLFHWTVASVLILLFYYDLLYLLVPRNIALAAAAGAFVGNVMLGESASSLILGAFIAGGFFFAQHAVSKGRWIGAGDIYLGLLMGATLGAGRTVLALFLAYVSGAIVGVAMMAGGKASMKTQVPFGTFLMAATLVAMLYGDSMIAWYLGHLL